MLDRKRFSRTLVMMMVGGLVTVAACKKKVEPPPPPPVLPLQSFFALLADPLAPEALYQVTVSGVTCLRVPISAVQWYTRSSPTARAAMVDWAEPRYWRSPG